MPLFNWILRVGAGLSYSSKYDGMREIESLIITQKMHELCGNYRGVIIHQTINLELGLDLFIAEFFAIEEYRMNDLFVLFSSAKSPITLYDKFTFLSYILKNYYKEFLNNHPKFLQIIQGIIDLRNIAGHRRIHFTEEIISNFDNNIIYLSWTASKKSKSKIEIFKLSGEVVDEFSNKIDEGMKGLNILMDSLKRNK